MGRHSTLGYFTIMVKSTNILHLFSYLSEAVRQECQPFYAAFLESVQIYSLVEAVQMKPIEKPMYRSGCRVNLLVLHCLNMFNFIR